MKIGDKVTFDGRPGVYKGEQAGLAIVSFTDGNKEEIAIAPQDLEELKPVARPKAS